MHTPPIILLSLFFASNAVGQILPFHQYSIETGLVSNGVTALLQDSKGYIWVGTGEGISVFDGMTFRNITAADGLPMNSVTCLAESRIEPGKIYVGTWGGGIGILENGMFTHVLPDSVVESRNIIKIHEDYRGNLWLLTSAGLYKRSAGSFMAVQDAGSVTGFALGVDSLLWVVRRGTLAAHSIDRLEKRHEFSLSSTQSAAALHQLGSGSLWVTSSDSFALEIRNSRIVARHKTPFGVAIDVADDAAGNLWVATRKNLFHFKRSQAGNGIFHRYDKRNGFNAEDVSACFVDDDNHLWVGGNGLFRLSNFNIVTFPIPDLPTGYNNSRAVSDMRGHVWVVTGRGLMEFWRDHQGPWRSRLHDVGMNRKGKSTPSVVMDRKGDLWVDNGDFVQQYGIDTSYTSSHLIAKQKLQAGDGIPMIPRFFFIVDSRENIWINSLGQGVYRGRLSYQGPAFSRYLAINGLPHNDIRAIYHDRSGNVWFGGVTGGVAMIPAGSDSVTTRYTMHSGLPDDYIRGIAEDDSGRIWLATRRNGIAIIDSGRIGSISVKDGLAGSAVWALALDSKNGVAWVGNQFGVQELDMNTLRPKPLRKVLAQGPTTALGIHRNQFLWFLTDRSLTICEYGKVKEVVRPPRVLLTKFILSGRERSLAGEQEFSHSENTAVFDFTALVFDEPEAVRFQYKLAGLEDDWRPPTAERTATYAPLPPGDFTFEVVALNKGILSEFPARVSFRIVPPLYLRWWFIAMTCAAIAALVWFMVRARVGRLLELERLRSRIARDLHDEIGSNLSSIAMASDLLRQRPGLGREEQRKLSEISATALDTVRDMRDMVWLMHPANDTLDSLLLRMKDVATSMLDGHEHKLYFPQTIDVRKLHLDWKRDVYLIYKEALANIIRHANATAVTIRVETEGERFILQIEDNGAGFDPEAKRGGNGLANMRHRAETLGAVLLIESGKLGGTSLRLETKIT